MLFRSVNGGVHGAIIENRQKWPRDEAGGLGITRDFKVLKLFAHPKDLLMARKCRINRSDAAWSAPTEHQREAPGREAPEC